MASEQVVVTVAVLAIVLLAVGLGITIPIIVELRSTLKTIRLQFRTTGPKIDAAAAELQGVLTDVRKLSLGLDGGGESLAQLLAATGDLAASLQRFSRGVNLASAVGTAVGPAVAAFVSTLRENQHSAHHTQETPDPMEEHQDA